MDAATGNKRQPTVARRQETSEDSSFQYFLHPNPCSAHAVTSSLRTRQSIFLLTYLYLLFYLCTFITPNQAN